MSAWKSAGISFNKYSAIAARTVRRALKEKERVSAEKRAFTDLKFQKWEKGNPTGEAAPLNYKA